MGLPQFRAVPTNLREWNNYLRDASITLDSATGALAVANGGTGATTAAAARTALGLGDIATQSGPLAVSKGGTGGATQLAARTALNAAVDSTATFTGTLTGCTSTITGSLVYSQAGKVVSLVIPDISGTSSSTSATITGLPSSVYPLTTQVVPCRVTDNGTIKAGYAKIDTAGLITLYIDVNLSGFTAAGSKGVNLSTLTYALN